MPKSKLKFALIGCGYMGRRYIQLLSQHSKCRLTALTDTDCNRLSEYRHSNFQLFHSTADYFNSNTDSDAVIVATPNGTHAAITLASLEQGKHVLTEKPMALKKSDADAIIQTAKEQGKKVMVVLQNRFSPVSVWLKKMVASKRLGKVFFVEVNCFWNRDDRYYEVGGWHGTKKMDGGTLFTQFSHFIDTLYWLLGDVKNIRSRFSNFNHQQFTEFEDTGSIQFELEQGGMGCFNFSTAVWDKTLESSITIIAEKGSIKISGQYMDRIEFCRVKDYRLPTVINVSSTSNHTKMINAFVDAILQNGSSNAQDASHSVDIIERMYASAYF